jgi:hypothetical protein
MNEEEKPQVGTMLQRERKTRGKERERHLEAGRKLATEQNHARSEEARVNAQEAALNSTNAIDQATR